MNSRERFLATMKYCDRDRFFHWEMEPYEETVLRWRKEGLPADSDLAQLAGYDRMEVVSLNAGICPRFVRKTLEKAENYEIYRDTDGAVKKRLIDVPPPSMPQYLEYPLKGKKQWHEFSKRLDPENPARFPSDWENIKEQYLDRNFPLGTPWCSLYGWLRNWMGLEGISLAMYDDRAFIEKAVDEITECIIGVLDKILKDTKFDFGCIWEDMAYKTSSLIDPMLYKNIFAPNYLRIVDRLNKAGIDIIMLDSDGNVEELIPCWLDIGINLILPMEAAAGMDVARLRKKFGKKLLMAGGMDKRILATDKPAIKQMVDEIIPLMREGGYIPGIDHEIPPDIPWDNFLYYRRLLSSIEV